MELIYTYLNVDVDLDLLEEEIPVRYIVPYEHEWWDELKSELKMRQFSVKEKNENTINLDRRVLKRLQLKYTVNKNDAWVYLDPKMRPSLVFLYISIIYINIFIFIFLFSFFILSTVPTINSFFDLFITSLKYFGFLYYVLFFFTLYYIWMIEKGKRFNPVINFKRYQPRVQEVKKAIQQSVDKIRKKYFPNIYIYERIKSKICPQCDEKIEKEWKICPICHFNLDTRNIDLPKDYIMEKIIDPGFKSYHFEYRKIDVSNPEEIFPKIKQMLIEDLRMRRMRFVKETKNCLKFTTRKYLRVRLIYTIKDNRISFRIKVGLRPIFILLMLLIMFIGLIPMYLLTIVSMGYPINPANLDYLDSSMIIFCIIMFLTLFFTLFSSFFVIIYSTIGTGFAKFPTFRIQVQKSFNYILKVLEPEIKKLPSETGETLICPSCNSNVRSHWKVCGYCGYRLKEG